MSAMRDEKVFEADTFDVFRTDRQRWHLLLGGGALRCLGEALAKDGARGRTCRAHRTHSPASI
jgi:cytochrome P450